MFSSISHSFYLYFIRLSLYHRYSNTKQSAHNIIGLYLLDQSKKLLKLQFVSSHQSLIYRQLRKN